MFRYHDGDSKYLQCKQSGRFSTIKAIFRFEIRPIWSPRPRPAAVTVGLVSHFSSGLKKVKKMSDMEAHERLMQEWPGGWLGIFSFLPQDILLARCQLVTKAWNANIPLVFSVFDAKDHWNVVTQDVKATEDVMTWVDDSFIMMTLPRFANLEALDLSNCSLVTDHGLHTILTTGSAFLRQLNLLLCHQITDATVVEISACCKQLTDLCLARCPNISDEALGLLGSQIRHLEWLDLSYCRKAPPDSKAKEFEPLLQVDVHILTRTHAQVTDNGLAALSVALEEHGGWQRLRHLALQGCPEISDVGVSALSMQCPSLVSLDMMWS